MPDDERSEGPGREGFVTEILREATDSGTPDEPPPPSEPQSVAMPRGGAGNAEDEPGGDADRSD